MAERDLTAEERDAVFNRRRADRKKIGLPARLETKAGTWYVALENISAEGAMVEAPNLPRVGKEILVQCGSISLNSKVVWAGSGRCGLAFENQADGEAIVRLQQEAEDARRARQASNEA